MAEYLWGHVKDGLSESGKLQFEEVIRENLDLGRPEKVSLIFNRRITKRTPGTFHTRVMTQGVIPSLYVSDKSSKIKQYFKEGRGLRTETTINHTHDVGIGRHLANLPALRAIGLTANRQLLDVETVAQDCVLAEGVFDQVTQPQVVGGQRAPALRFDDPRVLALFYRPVPVPHPARGLPPCPSAESPLLGHGAHSYRELHREHIERLALPACSLTDERLTPWPHNLFLELLSSQGLAGLLPFAGLLVWGVNRSYQSSCCINATNRLLASDSLAHLPSSSSHRS